MLYSVFCNTGLKQENVHILEAEIRKLLIAFCQLLDESIIAAVHGANIFFFTRTFFKHLEKAIYYTVYY